jgi:hypothetical protein
MQGTTLVAVALALLLGGVGQARAGLVLVTSRASLGANDGIDWGHLGPQFTPIPNPVTVTTTLGGSVVVAQQSGAGYRLDQNLATGFSGNFALNDHLYYTGFVQGSANQGPVTLTFAAPISGVGTQIEPDFNTGDQGSFQGFVTAYDSMGNALATFTENGKYNSAQDNSAMFIGVSDSIAEIAKITFGLTSAPVNNADFVINQVSIANQSPAAVPEPASLSLLGIGSLTLLGYGWRRRQQVKV